VQPSLKASPTVLQEVTGSFPPERLGYTFPHHSRSMKTASSLHTSSPAPSKEIYDHKQGVMSEIYGFYSAKTQVFSIHQLAMVNLETRDHGITHQKQLQSSHIIGCGR
jgi:hypothetical protein